MLQWKPFTNPPQDEEKIIVLTTDAKALLIMAYNKDHAEEFLGYVGWMPADKILNARKGYDPTFGDDVPCLCGHPYYRHFDTYEDMRPTGCKYCHYHIEGVEYQKQTPVPDNVVTNTYEDRAPYASICSGFKVDEIENVRSMLAESKAHLDAVENHPITVFLKADESPSK